MPCKNTLDAVQFEKHIFGDFSTFSSSFSPKKNLERNAWKLKRIRLQSLGFALKSNWHFSVRISQASSSFSSSDVCADHVRVFFCTRCRQRTRLFAFHIVCACHLIRLRTFDLSAMLGSAVTRITDIQSSRVYSGAATPEGMFNMFCIFIYLYKYD